MHKLAFDIEDMNEEQTSGKAFSLVIHNEWAQWSYKVEIAPPVGKSYASDIAKKYGVVYNMQFFFEFFSSPYWHIQYPEIFTTYKGSTTQVFWQAFKHFSFLLCLLLFKSSLILFICGLETLVIIFSSFKKRAAASSRWLKATAEFSDDSP